MLAMSDYDTMKADGWEYHRNGVSGCGFYCRMDDDTLQVSFNWADEDGEYNSDPIHVPMSLVRGMASRPADEVHGDIVVRQALADRFGIVVFDWERAAGTTTPFVGVTDLTVDRDDVRTAVFNVAMLEDSSVAFGYNSWRGDHVHVAILAALGR